jgi:hypothetical protein
VFAGLNPRVSVVLTLDKLFSWLLLAIAVLVGLVLRFCVVFNVEIYSTISITGMSIGGFTASSFTEYLGSEHSGRSLVTTSLNTMLEQI